MNKRVADLQHKIDSKTKQLEKIEEQLGRARENFNKFAERFYEVDTEVGRLKRELTHARRGTR